MIESCGGKLESKASQNTNILIIKDKSYEKTIKVKLARKLQKDYNIKVLDIGAFLKKYFHDIPKIINMKDIDDMLSTLVLKC